MILVRHDSYSDRFELAVQVTADDAAEQALGAIGGATVSRIPNDDGSPTTAVLVAFTWSRMEGVDDDTQADTQRREAKALIEGALVPVAAPVELTGVGSPL